MMFVVAVVAEPVMVVAQDAAGLQPSAGMKVAAVLGDDEPILGGVAAFGGGR